MRTIAICNQKGGVGKTACASNIGAGLGRLGKKVLMLDLDPQAHLSYSLGIMVHDMPEGEATMYPVLRDGAGLDEAARPGPFGTRVVPANIDLAAAEIELAQVRGRESLLRNAFEKWRAERGDADYLVIDCPPALGILTLNALTTVSEVFIPLQLEFLALHGLSRLVQTVETVRERGLNPSLAVTGLIGTRCDSRKTLAREVLESVRESFGDRLFETRIRENVSIAEAPSFGQTIFEYKPTSNGAVDYESLCREILAREKWPETPFHGPPRGQDR